MTPCSLRDSNQRNARARSVRMSPHVCCQVYKVQVSVSNIVADATGSRVHTTSIHKYPPSVSCHVPRCSIPSQHISPMMRPNELPQNPISINTWSKKKRAKQNSNKSKKKQKKQKKEQRQKQFFLKRENKKFQKLMVIIVFSNRRYQLSYARATLRGARAVNCVLICVRGYSCVDTTFESHFQMTWIHKQLDGTHEPRMI